MHSRAKKTGAKIKIQKKPKLRKEKFLPNISTIYFNLLAFKSNIINFLSPTSFQLLILESFNSQLAALLCSAD